MNITNRDELDDMYAERCVGGMSKEKMSEIIYTQIRDDLEKQTDSEFLDTVTESKYEYLIFPYVTGDISMTKIEIVHKENLRLIKKHNITVGSYLSPKDGEAVMGASVKSIHTLYGWIVSDKHIPQEVSLIVKRWNVKPNTGD